MKHVIVIMAAAALLQQGAVAQHSHGEEVAGELQCNAEPLNDYNMTLAIISVFVLLVISFAGAAFPALLALKRHHYLVLAIKFGSFAGSGVLLATGFVHMLLSANENLSSPCLSEGWLDAYPSWGSMFAVITIVLLQVLDYVLAVVLEPNPLESNPSVRRIDIPQVLPITTATTDIPTIQSTNDIEIGGSGSRDGIASVSPIDITNLDAGSERSEDQQSEPTECNKHPRCKDKECNGRALLPTPDSSLYTRRVSGLIISEVSICTHSIIIGLTLGVTQSSQFTALFIAIIFHQLLEGVALGSNASEAGLSTRQILTLAGIYSLTTPTGIAIGIGVRESLNTNSTPMLLTSGILDSIAAGTLIFLALDHMSALRQQNGWLRSQRILVQLSCFASFFIGAAVLLVLALWA